MTPMEQGLRVVGTVNLRFRKLSIKSRIKLDIKRKGYARWFTGT